MKNNLLPRWQTRIYHLTVFALLFTGFAQMPIFKRYYLADVPGFAWTADYYLNHRLHYVLAALLLFFMTYVTVSYLGAWRKKYTLTLAGGINVLFWLGIILTGLIRVAKNQPGIHFSPVTTMWVDWLHIGLVMLLGMFSLFMLLGGSNILRLRHDD